MLCFNKMAKFTVASSDDFDDSASSLAMVRDQLEGTDFLWKTRRTYFSSVSMIYAKNWYKCANIRTISTKVCRYEYVQRIGSTPKPFLKEISFSHDEEDEEEIGKIIDVIIQGTIAVEFFSFANYQIQESSWKKFEKFVDLHINSLKHLIFMFEYISYEVPIMLRIHPKK